MSRVEKIGDATLYLGDCREVLPTLGKVDAIVTDPPYGIGETGSKSRQADGVSRLGTKTRVVKWDKKDWDKEPPPRWVIELMREISEWQIIFGGNFYHLPPSSCWLVWDKKNSGDFADCELAWTNLPKAVRRIEWLWNGMIRKGSDVREHPTQKPLGVMTWAIDHLPDDARLICDPFMGSGTTGVAAVQKGLPFVGIEREAAYFDTACQRISEAVNAPKLFAAPPAAPVEQAAFAYDAAADFGKSIDVCYEAVRERKAAGGPGWPEPAIPTGEPTKGD